MTNYYPVIAKAVSDCNNSTGARRVIYHRARSAVRRQLRGAATTLTKSDITRELLALEEAIRKTETEATRLLLSYNPRPSSRHYEPLPVQIEEPDGIGMYHAGDPGSDFSPEPQTLTALPAFLARARSEDLRRQSPAVWRSATQKQKERSDAAKRSGHRRTLTVTIIASLVLAVAAALGLGKGFNIIGSFRPTPNFDGPTGTSALRDGGARPKNASTKRIGAAPRPNVAAAPIN